MEDQAVEQGQLQPTTEESQLQSEVLTELENQHGQQAEPAAAPESVAVAEPAAAPESVAVAEPAAAPESVAVAELAAASESVAVKEVAEPAAAPESVAVKEVVDPAAAKEAETEPEKMTKSEAGLENQPDNTEQKESEPKEQGGQQDQQALEMASVSGSPSALPFIFLEQEHTKDMLRASHTLFILRGLPGSGKSHLASTISDNYPDLCTIICADKHHIRPEKYAASKEGFKALDDEVESCLASGKAMVIVDDSNHTHARLARLGELAEQHQYLALFLEPRTKWSRDVEQLTKKTQRGLEKSQIQALLGPMDETSLPLFFGWFLSSTCQEKLRSIARDLLKTLGSLEDFKKRLSDFTGGAEKEVDLEQYFEEKGVLHCTTKFCDYGKAQSAKEYADKPVVSEMYGSVTELVLSTLFVTPKTAGAQVALTEKQLELWPADAEKEAMPTADLPFGSRAHITLGCAEGVEPVQTGLDLLEVVLLQQQGEKGELVQDLEMGQLFYYGKGMWVVSLREPFRAQACFSSYYSLPKEEDVKKEGEKKKKPKCAIL